MAIIEAQYSFFFSKRTSVDPWWVVTPEFSTTVKTVVTRTISTTQIVGNNAALGNDEDEPPFNVPCLVQDRTQRADGMTELSVTADVVDFRKTLKEELSEYESLTLTRDGSSFSLNAAATAAGFRLLSLTTTYGRAYSMAALDIYGDKRVMVLVNGTKVTEGTDKDGNSITEASYLEEGQSWRLDLAANMPDVTLYEALMPHAWLAGKRLFLDFDFSIGGDAVYTFFGDLQNEDYVYPFCLQKLNYTVGGCACAENVKIGEYVYSSRAGTVQYKEGWTDPLLGYTRDAGTAAAAVVTIGVNGLATTNNYLDDDGKPYTGLVYASRPEPTQSLDFLESFRIIKDLRRITFTSGVSLPWNTPLAVERGVCWITRKVLSGRVYSYEGVYYPTPLDLEYAEHMVVPLSPTTLVFPLYGGSKGFAAEGCKTDILPTYTSSWGTYTSSLTSSGLVIGGSVTFTPDILTIARNLNIRASNIDDPDWVTMGIAAPICKTETVTLSSTWGIKATAVGASVTAVTHMTRITDAEQSPIVITTGRMSPTAPQSALYWFCWAPRYYDETTATPSVSVMVGRVIITQKRSWAHCFAVVLTSSGTEVTREEITPSGTYASSYQPYTLWKVPYAVAQQGRPLLTSITAWLNYDSEKGTTGIVGEQFRLGFGCLSPLPYSE